MSEHKVTLVVTESRTFRTTVTLDEGAVKRLRSISNVAVGTDEYREGMDLLNGVMNEQDLEKRDVCVLMKVGNQSTFERIQL